MIIEQEWIGVNFYYQFWNIQFILVLWSHKYKLPGGSDEASLLGLLAIKLEYVIDHGIDYSVAGVVKVHGNTYGGGGGG